MCTVEMTYSSTTYLNLSGPRCSLFFNVCSSNANPYMAHFLVREISRLVQETWNCLLWQCWCSSCLFRLLLLVVRSLLFAQRPHCDVVMWGQLIAKPLESMSVCTLNIFCSALRYQLVKRKSNLNLPTFGKVLFWEAGSFLGNRFWFHFSFCSAVFFSCLLQ